MKTYRKPSDQLFPPLGGLSVTKTYLNYENIHKVQTAQTTKA